MIQNPRRHRRSLLEGAEDPEEQFGSGPMEFSLDTGKLVILVTGLCLVGVLVFVAGMLVGINIGVSGRSYEDVAPASPVAEDVDIRKDAAEDEVAESPAGEPEPPGPPPQAEAPSETEPPAPTQAAESIQSPAEEDLPFTVQVGAFRRKENAEAFGEALKERGYVSHIYTDWDSEGRLWSCVRIGAYPDREAASQAAAAYKAKENEDAIVRRSDSL